MISAVVSRDNICFVVQAADAVRTEESAAQRLHDEVRHHDLEHVKVNRNVAVVAAVGEKYVRHAGHRGACLQHTGQRRININRHRARLIGIQYFVLVGSASMSAP